MTDEPIRRCPWCGEPIKPGDPTGASGGETLHYHCSEYAEHADLQWAQYGD